MNRVMRRGYWLLLLLLLSGLCVPRMSWAYDLRENAILHADRGKLLLERGNAEMAAEEFRAAIRLNPYTSMSAVLYNNLGLSYRELKQYTQAMAAFQQASRLQPTYALYYQNLIETYVLAGRLATAQADLEAITRANPEDAEAWFMLGLLYREKDEKGKSREAFSRFLKLEPESELAKAARTAL